MLFSTKYKIIITPFLILLLCGFSKECTATESMGFVKIEFNKIISLLKTDEDKGTLKLLSRWHDYVKEITNHSNDDFLTAINSLQAEYYNEIKTYENRIREMRIIKKNHSPEWLDRLISNFGKNYVRENEDAILANIQLIFSQSENKHYQAVIERLVYKETELYGVYRYYFGLFNKYLARLNKDDRHKLKQQKELIGSFLSLIKEKSVTIVITENKIPDSILFDIEAKRLNKELYMHFKNNPAADSFNEMKATKELLEITREKKINP